MAARTVIIRLDSHVQPVDDECAGCGFDALYEINLYHLTTDGVTTLANATPCGRCASETQRTSITGE